MFLDLYRTDLLAGYRAVRRARQELLTRYRPALLQAHARRRAAHGLLLQRQQRNLAKFRLFLPLAGAAALLFVLAGALLEIFSDPWSGLPILAAGLLGGLGLGALWLLFSQKPAPPEDPLEQNTHANHISPLKQRLFPDLLPAWRQEMTRRVPLDLEARQMAAASKKYGLIGEYDFIRAIMRVTSRDTLVLHSLMPKPNDDMDVVLVGPKGIWYFEVKYLNAEILWHDGVWEIWQIGDFKTGELKRVVMNEYPDAQWYRMRAEARTVLETGATELLARVPEAGNIRGGVVFAHPRVSIDIEKSPSFVYGKTEAWVKALRSAPTQPGMTPEVIFAVAQALLRRHQQLNPGVGLVSMEKTAQRLAAASAKHIEDWIAAA